MKKFYVLNKVVDLSLVALLKKRLRQMFSCEFCETFKNIFSHRKSPVAASGLQQKFYEHSCRNFDILNFIEHIYWLKTKSG